MVSSASTSTLLSWAAGVKINCGFVVAVSTVRVVAVAVAVVREVLALVLALPKLGVLINSSDAGPLNTCAAVDAAAAGGGGGGGGGGGFFPAVAPTKTTTAHSTPTIMATTVRKGIRSLSQSHANPAAHSGCKLNKTSAFAADVDMNAELRQRFVPALHVVTTVLSARQHKDKQGAATRIHPQA